MCSIYKSKKHFKHVENNAMKWEIKWQRKAPKTPLTTAECEHTILDCIVLYTWCCASLFCMYACTICCVNSIRWEISLLHAFHQIYRWDTQWNFRARGNTFTAVFFLFYFCHFVQWQKWRFFSVGRSVSFIHFAQHTFPQSQQKEYT